MRARKSCAFQVADITARRQSFLALPHPVRPLAFLQPAKCNGRERLSLGRPSFSSARRVPLGSREATKRGIARRSSKTSPLISVLGTPFVRSLAPERKSTPVLSSLCDLFAKNTGGGGGHLDYGYVTTLLVCPPASAARLSPTIDNDHSAKRPPPTAAPMSFDFCVRHALHALFSARAKVNSCVIKRMRTLLQKHRGWGWASRLLLPNGDAASPPASAAGCRCLNAGVNFCNPR
jgi:hypothetical protein